MPPTGPPIMPPTAPSTPRHRWWLTTPAAAVLAAAALVVPLGRAEPAAAATATVTVDATRTLGTVPATGLGVNVAVYDGAINGPAIPGLLRGAGINAVRYPGGSYADIYHWKTHTADGGYEGRHQQRDLQRHDPAGRVGHRRVPGHPHRVEREPDRLHPGRPHLHELTAPDPAATPAAGPGRSQPAGGRSSAGAVSAAVS